MQTATAEKVADAPARLVTLTKPDAHSPAIVATSPVTLAIRAGVQVVAGARTVLFDKEREFELPSGIAAGTDLQIIVDADGKPAARIYSTNDNDDIVIGGGHFAPGGNARARSGSDAIPQLDPNGFWDINFRPAASDPRGLVYVANSPAFPELKPFWFGKYLLAQDHHNGVSRLGAVIADGRNLPDTIEGSGRFKKLDYATAKAIAEHHGMSLPSYAEYVAGAYGGTEKTASDERHEVTTLDPLRSSRFLVEAFGERWVWGHDGDPDDPRPSIFGGSWVYGGDAGSRYAHLVCWPEDSNDDIGVRLRSDHLQLA